MKIKGKASGKQGFGNGHSLSNTKLQLKSKGKFEAVKFPSEDLNLNSSASKTFYSPKKNSLHQTNTELGLHEAQISGALLCNKEKDESKELYTVSGSQKNDTQSPLKESSHNQLVENLDLEVPVIKEKEKTDNIKVIARFRPFNEVELDLMNRGIGDISVDYISKNQCSIINSAGFPQSFTFDRILDSSIGQSQMFEEAAKPVINDILKGYNGTIFTYGQSGSGKTHTMYGSSLYDEEMKGIIPRSIEYMFEFIDDIVNEGIKFQIKFSVLEIYKEMLYDLLNPERESKDLKIKETKDKQIFVSNLTEEYITSIDEFLMLIDQADQYRVVSETGLNKQSSRSHLLFIIEVLQQLPDGSERCGKLNLIDLAGNEKITKSGAVGETLEEAKKINLSLSTLGMVISNLSSEKDYIPYRDSKLTRILQDSLGGNYKTTLIVTCSPHSFNSEETIATLKFAMRAKKIKNKVKINIKKSVEELEKIIESLSQKLGKAKNEITRLRSLLQKLPNSVKEQYKIAVEPINVNNDSNEIHNVHDARKSLSIKLSAKNKEFCLTKHESHVLNYCKMARVEETEEDIELCGLDLNPIRSVSERKSRRRLNKNSQIINLMGSIQTFKNEDQSIHSDNSDSQNKLSQIAETKEALCKNVYKVNHCDHSECQSLKNESSNGICQFQVKYQILKERMDRIIIENEKLTSVSILLRESNIHLKEKMKDSNKSADVTNRIELLKIQEIAKDFQDVSCEVLEKLSDARNINLNMISQSIEDQNAYLKKYVSRQEAQFLDFFKSIKILENENEISLQLTQVLDSVMENSKRNLENNLESKSTRNGVLDRKFFKEILQFYCMKAEFLNQTTNFHFLTKDQIVSNPDLDQIKHKNIKAAFIK